MTVRAWNRPDIFYRWLGFEIGRRHWGFVVELTVPRINLKARRRVREQLRQEREAGL